MNLAERLHKKFVRAFNEWLTKNKRTRREFAVACKVDPSCVSCWYNGKSFPKWNKLERVSEVLGVSLEWWMSQNMDVIPSSVEAFKFSEDQKKTIGEMLIVEKARLDLTWNEFSDVVGVSPASLKKFIEGDPDHMTDILTERLYGWLKRRNAKPVIEDQNPDQGVLC